MISLINFQSTYMSKFCYLNELRNLPRPPDSIKVIQYADDIYIYATGKSIIESINVQGVPIKSAATLKQHYNITKRFVENIKTFLEL